MAEKNQAAAAGDAADGQEECLNKTQEFTQYTDVPQVQTKTLHVSLDEFIATLSADVKPEHGLIALSHPGSNSEAWNHSRWKPGNPPPDKRSYFFPTTLVPRQARGTKLHASKFDQGFTFAVVLDDVGTKVDPTLVKLAPTYKLETSPGNFQWGYKLSYSIPVAEADVIVEALIKAGLTDGGRPNLAGQLMRVPGSLNVKREPHFTARLTEWRPDLQYTWSELVVRLDVQVLGTEKNAAYRGRSLAAGETDPVLDWLEAHGMVLGQADGRGWVPVVCPWGEEHSDGNEASGYHPGAPGGWKCLHEHCKGRTTSTLKEWIKQTDPKAELSALSSSTVQSLRSALSSAQSAQPWPEPKPIIAALKPVPKFDAEALLAEPLRSWVMDEASRMPCPPEFVAVAALAAVGSIIGASCAMKPKANDNWLIIPNLWSAIVGDPSAKKSPAWGAGIRPLERLAARAVEEFNIQQIRHEIQKALSDAEKEAIKSKIKQDIKKGSKKISIEKHKSRLTVLADEVKSPPALRRYKTSDATVEKLGELLRENPRGILVMRDEIVGLLAGWEKPGHEGDKAFFLEAWNGNGSFDVDRIGRGHVHIDNVCLTVCGGIQPDKLAAYLELSTNALGNDGMLQRLQLMVYPDAIPWEWRDLPPNKEARDNAFEIFEKLADFKPAEYGAVRSDGYNKFPSFGFDDEAQAIFVGWSHDLHSNRLPNEDEPLMQQHLSKYDKLFPALALIFHLVDCVAHGTRGHVMPEAARRAAAWCEFLEAHARRVYGLFRDGGMRAAQALAAKLERGDLADGFTAYDVRRHDWRGLNNEEAVQAALDWLESDAWLHGEFAPPSRAGGRPTRRFRINPAVRRRVPARQ